MVTPALRDLFAARCAQLAPTARVRMLDGQARRALAAADVVLVASGTATLETALFKRPMVVAYKLGVITAFLLRTLGLVKMQHFSQPNLLAGKELVPEFFQEAASAENLAECTVALARTPRRGGAGAAGIRRHPRAPALRWRRARRGRNRRAASNATGGAAMKLRVRLRVAGVDEAGRGPLAGPGGGRGGDPESGAADSRAGGFQGARTRRARAPGAAHSRAGAVLLGGLGGCRRNRQHQYPAGDHAGHAPRLARPRRAAAAGVHRRQSLSLRGRPRVSNACSRR